MSLLDFNYWINMAMFIPAIMFHIGILCTCFNKLTPMRPMWILSSSLGMVAMVSFIIAQGHWVLNESHEHLTDKLAIIWLIFDYNNAAFYLATSATVFFTLRAHVVSIGSRCAVETVCSIKKR